MREQRGQKMLIVWSDELAHVLSEEFGNKKGSKLAKKYYEAFPTNYCEENSIVDAIQDILILEGLSPENPDFIELYVFHDELHLRLMQYKDQIPLSDILPLLENMDLKVLSENPYKIHAKEVDYWINDFIVSNSKVTADNIEYFKDDFEETFKLALFGTIENDGLNKLVIRSNLTGREVAILRVYTKYLRQIGFRFTQPYIEKTLLNNSEITKDLIEYFEAKFNSLKKNPKDQEALKTKIIQALDLVISLDEDKILRTFLALIDATVRTNYFQTNAKGMYKDYISIKFASDAIPELPLPIPLYEIFVYSPRFEAIHLRNSKVARGGLRLSDRPEDFRTEVLGLMKAQKVKNAVIVPSGAKGGFVLKMLPAQATREEYMNEAIACYKNFIRGLLDITDNLIAGKILKPKDVICYDDDDPYLVVAADKGTASFSDIANAISAEFSFWLEDAFASGGSLGYDHKKMGITAKGAWESIKRHFIELDLDVMKEDFTVIGIGDMSGDVFGNGMLYTPHIKLVAAFDHRHIFMDPNPDPFISYQERERLFRLPGSSWENYNPAVISKGGGVFKRSSKSIPISPEMRSVLAIQEASLPPNELVKAILMAPVDLFYNGGIGTYVKSSTESHVDVGDKANEYCRVNGCDLRCHVVGEGGNLGFTQLGRVEYALSGGKINTDFIDNSAGVDCSDHEVNIKILLNQEVAKKRITEKKRNQILANMTDEVAQLVLTDNYNQAIVLGIAGFLKNQFITIQTNYIRELEATGKLNRLVEFLPDEKKLMERKSVGLGLTSPELSVLLAYTKITIKNELLESDIPDQKYVDPIIATAFPASLVKMFPEAIKNHRLRREIAATQLSNRVVNEMGISFVYNLQVETGASVPEIIQAYLTASSVFQGMKIQAVIEDLDFILPYKMEYELLNYARQLIYLSTRWFLRNYHLNETNIPKIIDHYYTCVQQIADIIPSLMGGTSKTFYESLSQRFAEAGISKEKARMIAGIRALYTCLNIVQVDTGNGLHLKKTAEMYFKVGEKFNLLWFREAIAKETTEGFWENLARLTLRDELDTLQKTLTTVILPFEKKKGIEEAIQEWSEHHKHSLERWHKILEKIYQSPSVDHSMLFIALKELNDLINT